MLKLAIMLYAWMIHIQKNGELNRNEIYKIENTSNSSYGIQFKLIGINR